MRESRSSLASRLAAVGQDGVFAKYLARAGEAQLDRFFSELGCLDLAEFAQHRSALRDVAATELPDVEPFEPGTTDFDADGLARAGQESMSRGEWAVVIFAGGAGTRFFDAGADAGPFAKGLCPATPVAGRSLLGLHAAQTLAAGTAHGRLPFLVLMTSTKTYDEVANWLGASLLQGFPKPRVILLRQADRPRLDSDGDLIADETGSIVKTGDGHGGVFKALLHPDPRGGTLRGLLVEKGVRSLVMHNVDNVMARPLDPLRIGFHVRSGVRFTLTAVERRPGERVGIICRNRRTRRIEVLEYSVCPKEVCDAVDSIGRLRFNLAHINTNLVDLRCVRADLPSTLYTAKPYTVAGRDVSTSTWEMLNQHLVSLLPVPDAGVLLVDRDTYFLPIKSQHGADSLDTSMATQCAVDASRLRQACATVADTACVELDPCVDATVDSLDCRGWIVESGARLYLGIRGGPEGTPPIGPGFRLGRGAELQVAADLPYGELRLDERNGSIRVDPGTTPTCRFGHTITLKPGVVMRIRIRGNGSVLLPDNTTIGASINVDVASGTHQTIAGSR